MYGNFQSCFQLTWAVKWFLHYISCFVEYIDNLMKMTIFTGLKRVTETTVRGVMAEKQNSISIKKTTEKIPPRCPFLFFWSWIFTFQRSFPKHPYSRGPHVQHNKSRSVSWLVCETGLGLWVQLMFNKIF